MASGSTSQGSSSTAGARGSTAPRSGSTAVPSLGACACGSRRGCNFLHPPSSGSTVMYVWYYRAGLLRSSALSGGRHGSNFLLPCISCARRCLPCGSTVWAHGSTAPAVLPPVAQCNTSASGHYHASGSTAPCSGSTVASCGSTMALCGSTAMRGLRVGIMVGSSPPLYKGGLLPQEDHLFYPQTPLLLQAPFSSDLSP